MKLPHKRRNIWAGALGLGVLILVMGTVGCGKKLPPIPPDSLTPGRVRNFQIKQEGNGLVLSWLVPTVNIDNQPLTEIAGFHLLRGYEDLGRGGGCPPELEQVADIDLAYPVVGEVRGEAVFYRDTELAPGQRYSYQVVGVDRDRRVGVFSGILAFNWDVLPQPPEKVQAQAGDRLVVLTWAPVARLADGRPVPGGVTYDVYRRDPGGEVLKVNPQALNSPGFQDVSAANDVDYSYRVRAVRQVETNVLESLDSAAVTAKAEDLTPPAPVLNLVAALTVKGIELRWEAGQEKDLAGYRVWRRRPEEAQFQLAHAGLLRTVYFVDARVKKGGVYYYYVTAVDTSRRANESLPSEGVGMQY